jgi:hypothetical protein
MELKILLENLKKPFDYKWKIQSVPKEKNWEYKKWNCVAYMDARDAMDTLDRYCEEWWQSEFYEVKGKVFCKVWIKIAWEWLWRSDSGALESSENVEEETTSKWETSDAFKRACVQWGIGRFLYEKDIIWISNEEYQANKFKINEFCKAREWKPATPKTSYSAPAKPNTPTGKTATAWFNKPQLEQCIEQWFWYNFDSITMWAKDNWYTLSWPSRTMIDKYLSEWEL